MKYIPLLLIILFTYSCKSQKDSSLLEKAKKEIKNDEEIAVTNAKYIKYGAGDVVTNGYLDKNGDIWFTTTQEGVFKYDGNTFVNYTVEDGLCGNEVWAIEEDREGNMWFGTMNGLCKFDGKNYENIAIPHEDLETEWLKKSYPIVNPNGVVSLIQDKNGVFWIGSNGAGVYRYEKEKFTSYLKNRGKLMPDSLHHNTVFSITEDRAGHIWATSFSHGGVSEFNGEDFIHHSLKDGYGDGMIASSYLDSKGNIWFGTRNGGIVRYDGKTFDNIVDNRTGDQIAMATFLEDSNGMLWVSSYARKGVYQYDGASFSNFEIKDSEKLVDIKCIAEDKEGNIWFGGRYGILWKYNGQELKEYTHLKRNL